MENKSEINANLITNSLQICFFLSIGLGLLLTTTYFISIGYFPQGDFNAYISMFAYLSTLSLLCIGMIPLISLLAAITWIKNIFGNPKISRWLLKPEEMELACNISGYNHTIDSPPSENVLRKMMGYYAISNIIGVVLIYTTINSKMLSKTTAIAILASIFITLISLYLTPGYTWNKKNWDQESVKRNCLEATSTEITKLQITIFFLTVVCNTIVASSLLLLVISFALKILSKSQTEIQIGLGYKFILTMLTIVLSVIWYIYPRENNKLFKVILAYFAVFITLFLPILEEPLTNTIIKKSKLSSPKSAIYVEYDTCQMFNDLGKPVTCNKDGLTKIDDLDIKWRGAEEYITFNTTDDKKNILPHYLIIPGTAVKGTEFLVDSDVKSDQTTHKTTQLS